MKTETTRRSAAAGELTALIEAHRMAEQAFARVCKEEDEAVNAFRAAHGAGFRVQCFLGFEIESSLYDRNQCKQMIADAFENERKRLANIERVAPELIAQTRAALSSREAENIKLVDDLFEEDAARQERFGLTELKKRWDALDQAEKEAAEALCAYHCKTIEEAKARAAYVLSHPTIRDNVDECARAILNSFFSNDDLSAMGVQS